MKTNLSKSVKFLIAIAAQLTIIFGLVVFNASLLARGTEVLLPIEPFDPRDPLRGDYAVLRYQISEINRAMFADEDQDIIKNRKVYVVLAKKDNYWVAESVSVKKPEQGLFISGNVGYVSSYRKTVTVSYGIEEYFIPEGTGAALEKKMRAQQAFAKVVIDKNGKAILKDVVFADEAPQSGALPNSSPPATSSVAPNIKTTDSVANIQTTPVPLNWDVSVKFDQAHCNDIYVFSQEVGKTGKIYYADLNGSSDNLFKEFYGKDCCSAGSSYAKTYEENGATRKGPWVVERKYIDQDNYRILIRGASKADCSCGGGGYVKGEVVINPKNWHIVKVVKNEVNKDTRGRDIYCDINQNNGQIKFAAGSSCSGCCACIDSGDIDIEVIVAKGPAQMERNNSSDIIPALDTGPYVKIISPNGKEQFCLGDKMKIEWESAGLELVGIRLAEATMSGSRFYYLGNNSVPASSDESGASGKGNAVWAIKNVPVGQGYKIEIMGLGENSKIRDTSDSFFSIVPCES